MLRRDAHLHDACPFIEDNDNRCASHFTLTRLSDAFSDCMDGYRGCATYWRLVRENPSRLIALTAHGKSLQPTGT